jgi:hypothetical protein
VSRDRVNGRHCPAEGRSGGLAMTTLPTLRWNGDIEPTSDPYVVIEARKAAADGTPFIVYASVDGAERWVIAGTCNQCGQCEVGSSREKLLTWIRPVGESGACIDPDYATRLDLPVRPEISHNNPACSLRGRYLTGGQHRSDAGRAADITDRDVPLSMR